MLRDCILYVSVPYAYMHSRSFQHFGSTSYHSPVLLKCWKDRSFSAAMIS